jgi:hypothetical protein
MPLVTVHDALINRAYDVGMYARHYLRVSEAAENGCDMLFLLEMHADALVPASQLDILQSPHVPKVKTRLSLGSFVLWCFT